MQTQLSDKAWTLLAMLHREADGGPRVPTAAEFADAYAELVDRDLVSMRHITREGYSLMTARYLGGYDTNALVRLGGSRSNRAGP